MFTEKHKAYIAEVLSKMPEGIKRAEIGWCCSKCDTVRLNQQSAMKHNCKKQRDKFAKKVNNMRAGSPAIEELLSKVSKYGH